MALLVAALMVMIQAALALGSAWATDHTSVSLSSSENPSTVGRSVTFTATVTGGSSTPSGTVTFMDGAAPLGESTLDGSGVASFSTSSLSQGSHAITARYGGDAAHPEATSAVLDQAVRAAPAPSTSTPAPSKAATTTRLSSTPNPSSADQRVTFTITVTGGSTTPTGTVSVNAPGGSDLLLDPNGQVTFSSTSLAPGSHVLRARYSGDDTHLGSTSREITQVVEASATVTPPAPTTTVLTSTGGTSGGEPVTLTATVQMTAASEGPEPVTQGTVGFFDDAVQLGSGALDGEGVAMLTTTLPAGEHRIIARYTGDARHSSSESTPLILQISGAIPKKGGAGWVGPALLGVAAVLVLGGAVTMGRRRTRGRYGSATVRGRAASLSVNDDAASANGSAGRNLDEFREPARSILQNFVDLTRANGLVLRRTNLVGDGSDATTATAGEDQIFDRWGQLVTEGDAPAGPSLAGRGLDQLEGIREPARSILQNFVDFLNANGFVLRQANLVGDGSDATTATAGEDQIFDRWGQLVTEGDAPAGPALAGRGLDQLEGIREPARSILQNFVGLTRANGLVLRRTNLVGDGSDATTATAGEDQIFDRWGQLVTEGDAPAGPSLAGRGLDQLEGIREPARSILQNFVDFLDANGFVLRQTSFAVEGSGGAGAAPMDGPDGSSLPTTGPRSG